jgi:predicted DNA-binding protein YlxM (UPF0122 family)
LREQGGRDSERGERTSRENVREEFISHENPEELACRNEMARLVRSLIDRLPGKQREVMLKMYVEHHSLGSAAEAMGISRNAASTHLARAKQALWAMHEIQQLADHSNSEPPVPREPAKTVGRSLQNLPKLILILFAVRGEVADACNLDMPCGVCTAKNDDDEVSREDSGHHQADKQRRKSLMRLPLRPVAAVAGRTVLDREHPSVRARLAERREASTLLPDFGPSRNDRRDGGGILSFRTAQSARSPCKVPRGTTLEAA